MGLKKRGVHCVVSMSSTWIVYAGMVWRNFVAAPAEWVMRGTMCFGSVMELVSFLVAPRRVVMVIAGRMCAAPVILIGTCWALRRR